MVVFDSAAASISSLFSCFHRSPLLEAPVIPSCRSNNNAGMNNVTIDMITLLQLNHADFDLPFGHFWPVLTPFSSVFEPFSLSSSSTVSPAFPLDEEASVKPRRTQSAENKTISFAEYFPPLAHNDCRVSFTTCAAQTESPRFDLGAQELKSFHLSSVICNLSSVICHLSAESPPTPPLGNMRIFLWPWTYTYFM